MAIGLKSTPLKADVSEWRADGTVIHSERSSAILGTAGYDLGLSVEVGSRQPKDEQKVNDAQPDKSPNKSQNSKAADTGANWSRQDIVHHARLAAAAYGLPQELFLALIRQESAFKLNALSKAGAYGLTQLMPATARYLGVDRTNPVQNLDGGARYLKQQLARFGSWPLALAAYNAGPEAVARYGGIPPYPETQNYVRKIMADVGGRLPVLTAKPEPAHARASRSEVMPEPQPNVMEF